MLQNWGQYSSNAVVDWFTFYFNLIDTIGERPKKKNVELLDLPRKVNILKL